MATQKKPNNKKSGGKRVAPPPKGNAPFRRELAGIICAFFGIFTLISYFPVEAVFIKTFAVILKGLTGVGFWLYAPVFFLCAYILLLHQGQPVLQRVVCAQLIPFSFTCLCYGLISKDLRLPWTDLSGLWMQGQEMRGCGIIGSWLGGISTTCFSSIGTVLIFLVMSFFLGLSAFDRSIMDIIDWYAARPAYEPPPPKDKTSPSPKKEKSLSEPVSPPRKMEKKISEVPPPKDEDRKPKLKKVEKPPRPPKPKLRPLARHLENAPWDGEGTPPPTMTEHKGKKTFDIPFGKDKTPTPTAQEVYAELVDEAKTPKEVPMPANVHPTYDPVDTNIFAHGEDLNVSQSAKSVPDPLTAYPKEEKVKKGTSIFDPLIEANPFGFFNKKKEVVSPDEVLQADAFPNDVPLTKAESFETEEKPPLVTLPVADIKVEPVPVTEKEKPLVKPPVIETVIDTKEIFSDSLIATKIVPPISDSLLDTVTASMSSPLLDSLKEKKESPTESQEETSAEKSEVMSEVKSVVTAEENSEKSCDPITDTSIQESNIFEKTSPPIASSPFIQERSYDSPAVSERKEDPFFTPSETEPSPIKEVEPVNETPIFKAEPVETLVKKPIWEPDLVSTLVSDPIAKETFVPQTLEIEKTFVTESQPEKPKTDPDAEYSQVAEDIFDRSPIKRPLSGLSLTIGEEAESSVATPIETSERVTEDISEKIYDDIRDSSEISPPIQPIMSDQPRPISTPVETKTPEPTEQFTTVHNFTTESPIESQEKPLGSFDVKVDNSGDSVTASGFSLPTYREEDKPSLEISTQLPEEKKEYVHPPLSLLRPASEVDTSAQQSELQNNLKRLEETLSSFGIKATMKDVVQGPSVTRYEVELEQGVKLSKLTNLSDDIALAFGAVGVRIAPVMGKISTVGVEVPNQVVTPVEISQVLGSANFFDASSSVSFAVGKDITGQAIIGDIAKMPHLLVAGTTGAGKSVCTNSLITSLLYKSSPEEVRLIMVDPKVVELSIYNGIPHLLIPVVTDSKKAAGALEWAVYEMEKRYRFFADVGTRDLAGYNAAMEQSGGEKLPKIVVIIDELADLMMVVGKEVEQSINRVAQMGRASGMHLIIATQRPSTDVLTGLVKANVPSRISFAVSSNTDSRIILGEGGAEKLVGRGDMLYKPQGENIPHRVQGCFITDEEVTAVVNFVKTENSVATYSEEIMEQIEQSVAAKEKNATKGGSNQNPPDISGDEEQDEMLYPAIDMILENNQASVSMLQRRLKLGYARAARIVDFIEDMGIVGPNEGGKPRQILISKEKWAEIQYRRGNPTLSGGTAPTDSSSNDGDAPWQSSSSEESF